MKLARVTWSPNELIQSYYSNPLLDVGVAKVAILYRGRNAWHSTWVQHFLDKSELFLDAASAKLAAESMRGPGNKFYISEVPALILKSDKFLIAIVDANESEPFKNFVGFSFDLVENPIGNYIEGIFPGINIFDALRLFEDVPLSWRHPVPDNHLLLSGLIPDNPDLDSSLDSFDSFVSEPQGSGYVLAWSPTKNTQIINGLSTSLKAWERLNKEKKSSEFSSAKPRLIWRQEISDRLKEIRKDWADSEKKVAVCEELVNKLVLDLVVVQKELTRATNDRMRVAETSQQIASQRVRLEEARERSEQLEAQLSLEREKLKQQKDIVRNFARQYFDLNSQRRERKVSD